MKLNKTFRNTAPSPLSIALVAYANDTAVYGLSANGLAALSDLARAEAERMVKWAEKTFIGRPAKDFTNHDGVVPDGTGIAELDFADLELRIFASGMADPLNLDQRERRYTPITTTQVEEFIYRNMARALGLSEHAEVGHERFDEAPLVGTYWQCRERPVRFFVATSKHECEGHTHVRLTRVDHARGGEYDFIYENAEQWDRSFKRVAATDVPGNANPGRTVVLMDRGECKVSFDGFDPIPASKLTDDQLNAVVTEHGEAHPGLREFLEEQRPALEGVPTYMQQFLDMLDFTGAESPPAVGERYFSWISGATYKVVDVRRKLHQTDYYVTMEREPDGRRAKYTYRNHATWLTTWRPVDDEGNARQVEMVDVPTTAIDMTLVDSNDMRRVEPGDFLVDPEVELRRLYRELDRKVPGWREAGDGDHVFLDNASLAIRAIRSLHKHMTGYQRGIDALKEAVARRDETLAENSKNRRKDTDTLRDAVMVFSKMFAEQFGREALKQQVVAMNATSVANLPFDQIVPFMQRCRLYASRHEG